MKNRFFQSIAVAVLLSAFIYSPNLMAASDEEGITTGQYVTGGILGSVIGLGIGHAVQKRYMPLGLVFTLGEAAGYAAILADSWTTNDYDTTWGYSSKKLHLGTAGTIGLVALVGLHIWEVVDLWVNGLEHRRDKKTTDLEPASRSTVAIIPVSGNSEAPGMSVFVRF